MRIADRARLAWTLPKNLIRRRIRGGHRLLKLLNDFGATRHPASMTVKSGVFCLLRLSIARRKTCTPSSGISCPAKTVMTSS